MAVVEIILVWSRTKIILVDVIVCMEYCGEWDNNIII